MGWLRLARLGSPPALVTTIEVDVISKGRLERGNQKLAPLPFPRFVEPCATHAGHHALDGNRQSVMETHGPALMAPAAPAAFSKESLAAATLVGVHPTIL